MKAALIALLALMGVAPNLLQGQESREIVWMRGTPGATHIEAAEASDQIWVWGDYPTPPPACDPESMVRRLDAFFRAVTSADTTLVTEFFSGPGGPGFQWYTMSEPGTQQVEIRDLETLRSYFSERFERDERIELQGLSLNRWSGEAAHFGPVVVTRSARDLTGGQRTVTGKGAIHCATGKFIVLSLATGSA